MRIPRLHTQPNRAHWSTRFHPAIATSHSCQRPYVEFGLVPEVMLRWESVPPAHTGWTLPEQHTVVDALNLDPDGVHVVLRWVGVWDLRTT